MKKNFITYSNHKYENTKQYLIKSAKKMKYFDVIKSFGPEDIDSDFKEKYKKILSVERGNGLWLWKPYFIKKEYDKLENGDILFYCDSGAFFINSPKKIEKEIEDIYVSKIPLIEEQFTKNDVFEKLNCSEKIKKSNQIIATYIILKKTPKTTKILDEWFELCKNYDLISPENGKKGDYFISHREDQSLLSIVCKENGIYGYADITQRGWLQYTYWNDGYVFKKVNFKKRKNILFLHKLPKINVYISLKMFVRQIQTNFTKYIKVKRNK